MVVTGPTAGAIRPGDIARAVCTLLMLALGLLTLEDFNKYFESSGMAVLAEILESSPFQAGACAARRTTVATLEVAIGASLTALSASLGDFSATLQARLAQRG